MIRPPDSTDLDGVRSGKASLVLFQIKASVDEKAISPIGLDFFGSSVRLWLANLGERESPQQIIAQRAPSEATAAQGWHYMLLPPGTYYMLALPPGGHQNPSQLAFHVPSAKFGRLTRFESHRRDTGRYSDLGFTMIADQRPDDFRELPGFWFEVPLHRPIVYVGTLSLACTGGRGLLGDLIESCGDFVSTTDSRAAQEIAASAFPGLGSVSTEPMALYGKARRELSLSDGIAARYLASQGPAIGKAGMGSGVGSPVDAGSAVIFMAFAVIAAPLFLADHVMNADSRERRRVAEQVCLERLASSLPADTLGEIVQMAIASAFRVRGAGVEFAQGEAAHATGQPTPVSQRLSVSVPMLQWRESTQPDNLAIQLGVQVRVQAIDTGRVAYESFLVYAEDYPVENPLTKRTRLYERLVPVRPAPHAMAEWCGTGGQALLDAAVRTGMNAIASQLVLDLVAAP